MQRRFFLHSAATLTASALAAVGGFHGAHAQSRPSETFPSKPIRLVIAFPAGGPTDSVVRTLAGNASDILGQPVRVDNRPGAGGSLPLAQLQLAAADGYTLAQIPVSVFLSSSPDAKNDVNPRDKLVQVINVTGYTLGLALSPDSPFMGWTSFVDWARAYLGQLAYGPGSPPLTLDLISDKLRQRVLQQIDRGILSRPGALVAQADAGGAPSLELPTLKELGLGLIQNEPFGIAAPRGTPPAVVGQLHDAFRKAMAQENFKRTLAQSQNT